MKYEDRVQSIVLISDPTANTLTEKQLVTYRNHRENYIDWLCNRGKSPEKREGYAYDTANNYAHISDRWHRHVWDDRGFTMNLSHDDADDYLDAMMVSENDYSGSHLHNIKLALKTHFRFIGDEWETNIVISSPSHAVKPKNFLSMEERRKIREAALEYSTIPAYYGLTPEDRLKWKLYLARRYGKPVSEVSPDDWDRANGYKYVSIVWTAIDAGLRPVEVARARTGWIDTENAMLRIPLREASKSFNNWSVPIREDTADYLALWLEEREMYEKYDDTDRLWLTRHDNPYRGSALRVLLDNLREIAGIERDFSWYAIRHSTGTYMARKEGLAAAQKQLRHLKEETTMKYDQTPDEDLRNALNRM